uniref:Zinc finger FYVE domain-containing protein 26 n=1 Tax=Aceria tosichella TaxID=561515 RepID=A0A6G1SEV1_9ACAR
MISQADIIRTLVNQNCTDESIMSTALSPDCTPPKLLEKFTEAERFDLALDVSMKLGWDVLPLWKTWAMRCLKNRNFQGARDKFRHCFQRIRAPNGRSKLLCDILRVLSRMEENKPALSDEIELIKQRKGLSGKVGCNDDDETDHSTGKQTALKMNETKPKIYDECMHYLQEYGNNEQRIQFYVTNQLWEQAIENLFDFRDQINLDRYFINDVISYSSTTGHLDDIIAAFIKQDRGFQKSSKYFEAIYKYYNNNKRYHSLYYVQNAIGDHVAAAENQVNNFFLMKPTTSYKELNQRLTSLISAKQDYQQHLIKLEQSSAKKNPLDGQENQLKTNEPELFTKLTKEDTETRLRTIDTQIEITRNFAINEVTGCINGIEVVVSDSSSELKLKSADDDTTTNDASPVTLFEQCERRRTFLAALIMVYYDSDCHSYFSDSGIELANRVIAESGLDRLHVFRTAMRIILEDESSDIVENTKLLLKRLQDDYLACTKRTKSRSTPRSQPITSSNDSDSVISQPMEASRVVRTVTLPKSPSKSSFGQSQTVKDSKKAAYSFNPKDKNIQPGTIKAARLLCDDVIRDSIRICREPDYKMELSKLLSVEARIELNIELGKLSIAQRLAFDTNRPDYVAMILKEADRLNQDHVKDVCQHWLAKH